MVVTPTFAAAGLRRADLVLNFRYAIDARLLAPARRTAVVDIDPGLTQIWVANGQLRVARHDVHFTIGEHVAGDADRHWISIRPPVCLERWPYVHDPRAAAFTTVAGWWSGKWVKLVEDGIATCHDNNKRIAFLAALELP